MWGEGSEGERGGEGAKRHVILGFRLPTTCMGRGSQSTTKVWCGVRGARGARGARQGARGSEGGEVHVILGFRVPTTCDGVSPPQGARG